MSKSPRVRPCLALLALAIAYLTLAHYFFLGFTGWDGFTFRTTPVVELVQNGSFGGEKFDSAYLRHPTPFFELVNAPFLMAFGLRGLYLGFALVLLPASVLAVYWFVLEALGDRRAAVYGAAAFLAIPFVNEQAFAAYVDFAVAGALAAYLAALMWSMRCSAMTCRTGAAVGATALVLSFGRLHWTWAAIALFPVVAGATAWAAPAGERKRVARRAVHLGLFVLPGVAPAVVLQAWRWVEYGSPLYPYAVELFGYRSAGGNSLTRVLSDAGLTDPSWAGLLAEAVKRWFWSPEPPFLFFDSSRVALGILPWLAMPLALWLLPRTSARFRVLVGALILWSLLTRDLWNPRYAAGLVLLTATAMGGGAALARKTGRRGLHFLLVGILAVQLVGRPVWSAVCLQEGTRYIPRANLSESPWLIGGAPGILGCMPDWHRELTVVGPVNRNMVVLLYGRRLSNRIAEGVPSGEILTNERCRELLVRARGATPERFIIDHGDRLATRAGLAVAATTRWGRLAYAPRPVPGTLTPEPSGDGALVVDDFRRPGINAVGGRRELFVGPATRLSASIDETSGVLSVQFSAESPGYFGLDLTVTDFDRATLGRRFLDARRRDAVEVRFRGAPQAVTLTVRDWEGAQYGPVRRALLSSAESGWRTVEFDLAACDLRIERGAVESIAVAFECPPGGPREFVVDEIRLH